jgi:hypothetical protein
MVTIYVEGGGDTASLKSQCRRAFSDLLRKAGFAGKMPSVRAMGSRRAAFDAFETALGDRRKSEFVVLLVDSEEIPASKDAWAHLKARDGWNRPDGASDEHAQLMVACMESWLIADAEALEEYFGPEFKKDKLPITELETRSKEDVLNAIAAATAPSRPKGKYGKARDSFKLLGQIDPEKLRNTCAWAKRFFEALGKHC